LISSNNPFIVKKQADLLFRNVRLGQISSILNASFLLWVVTSLNTSESHLAVAIWWLVATITAILRIWIANKYLAKDDVTRLDNAALWQKRAVLGAGASGIVWGAGALLLMFGATTTMQLFTAFVMAGVVAGAVPVLAANRQAFRYYAWPIVLTVAIGSLGADPLHIAFSVMTLLFLSIATRSADYFHEALQDTFRLEHEKDSLVEDLQRANQLAENSNRAKTEFLANVSHELRTPMNGILGMADLLDMEELSADQRSYLTPLRRSADDLLQLINHMIELSKLESGQIHFNPSPFAAPTLLNDLLNNLVNDASKKGLTLHLQNDNSLPDVLIGDIEHLRQILQHLVGNAVKFTEQGDVSVSLKVFEQSKNRLKLAFAISDTGPGIAPEKVQQLLSGLFVQVDGSVVRRHGGTGIGLPIARKLVELLGGRLNVESQLGVGSTFSFAIPVERFLSD
jgi:signal transduction histidine kinase